MSKVATNLLGCRVEVKRQYAQKWGVMYEGIVRAVSCRNGVITLLLELTADHHSIFGDSPTLSLVTVMLDSEVQVLVVPEAT